MGRVKKLMEVQLMGMMIPAFDNTLDAADEALLDKLEAEWLARQRGEELEDYDYYSSQKEVKKTIL